MDDQESLHTLIAALQERNRRLGMLYETARDLGAALRLDELLDRILARALQALRADIGSILVVDSEDEKLLRLQVSRGLPAEPVEGVSVRAGEGISGWVAKRREPLLVQDVESDPRFPGGDVERTMTGSLIAVPLLARNRLFGVMSANSKQGNEPFTAEDLDLLVAIAGQAAVAIANARFYGEALALTHLDPVTRLYNHGYFQRVLTREIARAERYERSLALVLVDVDDFKPYNDRYEHVSGDEALREIADLIYVQSRSSDIVARAGEDSFAVVLPETDSKGAFLFAEKVRESIAAHPFPGPAGDIAVHLTVSIGVAAYPEDARDRMDLYDVADSALHSAKFAGKNRVSGFEDV